MFKKGDKVTLYLDEVIEENKKKRAKCYHLLDFWKAINGKYGVVENAVSDEEIWVRGNRTNEVRMFNAATLKKREDND